jgi:hypothetical protein
MAQAPIYYPDSLLEVDCVLLLERLKKPVPESPREVFAATLAHVREVLALDTGANYAITSALRSRESRLESALKRAEQETAT